MFRDMEVARGSIGTGMARLWKGEVGAVALRHGHETPWDMCPIVGISQRLGFRFLRVTETGRLAPYEPQIDRRRNPGIAPGRAGGTLQPPGRAFRLPRLAGQSGRRGAAHTPVAIPHGGSQSAR